jgi:RNAse (barnase) inhibitor barstar
MMFASKIFISLDDFKTFDFLDDIYQNFYQIFNLFVKMFTRFLIYLSKCLPDRMVFVDVKIENVNFSVNRYCRKNRARKLTINVFLHLEKMFYIISLYWMLK